MHSQLSILRFALAAGALVIVGLGLFFVASGEWWGWVLVVFGISDLMTVPLVVRAIGRNAAASDVRAPTSAPGEDPSYNPYARED